MSASSGALSCRPSPLQPRYVLSFRHASWSGRYKAAPLGCKANLSFYTVLYFCIRHDLPELQLSSQMRLLRVATLMAGMYLTDDGLPMSRNAAFREIERKLAESLAQLEEKKKAERLREAREFGDELRALMKSYRLTAADVVGILHSATETPPAR